MSEVDPACIKRLADAAWCFNDNEECYGALAGDIRALLALAHGQFDWQPIETAPRDGSTFLTFSGGGGTYDFAEFDLKHGEFVKHGCGWDYATHWSRPTPAP